MMNQTLNQNRPSNEAVISINHITEKIFSYLQPPELLVCRLVSRYFHSLAQKPLEDLVKFTFSDENLVSTLKSSDNTSQPFSVKQNKSLSNLSQELQTGLSSLPVVEFSFIGTPLRNPVLQQFLSFNGHNIEHLSLTYHPQDRHSYLPHESELMDQLTTLLLVQTTNLQSLKINFRCEVSWINSSLQNPRYSNSVLKQTDPELQTIIQKCNSQTLPLNKSLKLLQMPEPINAKILETIIRLCPSLEEVELGKKDSEWAYFLNPQNRIHLIKSMEFNLDRVQIDNYEKLLANSNSVLNSNPTLKLRNINFNHSEAFLRGLRVWVDDYETLINERIVTGINRILKSSWDSLESIKWEGDDFLSGIKFPQVMPKVRHLCLEIKFEFGSRTELPYLPSTSFLSGLNWSDVFPTLESLEIFLPKYRHDFENFFTWLDVQSALPKVSWILIVGVESERMFSDFYSLLRVYFPNAQVKR